MPLYVPRRRHSFGLEFVCCFAIAALGFGIGGCAAVTDGLRRLLALRLLRSLMRSADFDAGGFAATFFVFLRCTAFAVFLTFALGRWLFR